MLVVCALLRLVFRIHQYFDGKHTDDEILFKAEISRKQMRQILHHYDEYVSVFLIGVSLMLNGCLVADVSSSLSGMFTSS